MEKAILWAMRGGADAALGADDGDDAADRLGVGRREQAAHRTHDLQCADRRDQIIAHAAPHQLAIERDVVHAADDDDPRRRVAYRRKLIEAAEDILAAVFGFENDDVRRRRILIGLDGGDQAAHLDAQMRLGHAPILAGRLDGGGSLDGFAERLHRDARRRRDALFAAGDVGRNALLPSGLASWFRHIMRLHHLAKIADFA